MTAHHRPNAGTLPGTLAELPPPPAHLPAEAAAAYTVAGEFLIARMRLTAGDVVTLVAYAMTVARIAAIERTIANDGHMLDGKPHPLFVPLNQAHINLRGYAQIMGLASNTRSQWGEVAPVGLPLTPTTPGPSPLALASTRARRAA